MDNEKMVTEREARIRERKAFENGAVCWAVEGASRIRGNACRTYSGVELKEILADAAEKFPLPKRVVPRVVVLGPTAYRVVNGELEAGSALGKGWGPAVGYANREGVFAIADLYRNPTEELEDSVAEDRT